MRKKNKHRLLIKRIVLFFLVLFSYCSVISCTDYPDYTGMCFARIKSPNNGTIFEEGDSIEFRADITGYHSKISMVKWTSDKDGDLERQTYDPPEEKVTYFFSSDALTVNVHAIKCIVFYKKPDGHERGCSDSIVINITEKNADTTTTTKTDLSNFNRASIAFKTINYLERTGQIPEEVTNGTSLSDGGHQGSFSGDTYTLDYEIVGVGNVRIIIEITITLNSQHNAILEAEYHRSEDDEDVASYYELSEFFRAYDIPVSITSSEKLVFRIEGQDVCDTIEQYKYVQVKNENFTRIESLDRCEENSWLEIQLYQ